MAMEVVKPVLLFLVGVVAATIFFVFGFDHALPHWMRFPRAEPIGLAIVPSSAGAPAGCPVSYAIDNRTDQPVDLTMADSFGGPPSPYGQGWQDQRQQHDWDRAPPSSFHVGADMIGLDQLLPDSSEPAINAPDDLNAGDSNYGGSMAEYGNEGGNRYGNGYGDQQYGSSDEAGYGSTGWNYQEQSLPPPVVGSASGSVGPPPPPVTPQGQSIPLTPPDNASPYGAPQASPYGPPQQPYGPALQQYGPGYGGNGYGPGYGGNGYGPGYGGNGYGYGYGPPANRIRPGEIFFASSGGGDVENCDRYSNTVTVQLSN